MSLSAQPSRGFVLVNALVLVAALAAVATLLLMRAESGRARLETGFEAAQITLNLDAFEALAITLLERDTGALDHAGEPWAAALFEVPLERGHVSGQIRDLQGRFNVNWLLDENNIAAQAAFDRLLNRQGVSEQTGQIMRDALRVGGPDDASPWGRLIPPETPVGGALLAGDQLGHIPGLRPNILARLRPLLTALPGDSRLNVNTAPAEVLAAFLPRLSDARLNRMLARRAQEPFVSVEEFLATVGIALPQEEDKEEDGDGSAPPPPALEQEHLSVGSDWFRAEISATLKDRDGLREAQRSVVLHRQGLPPRVQTAWRITVRP